MQKPVTLEVSEDNIIKLSINGDLLDQQIDDLSNSLQEATEIINNTFSSLQKKLKILVDLNNFSGRYTVKPLVKMVEFSNTTKKFVEKTAICSSSDKDKMAAEMVAALSGRSDFKTFNTKEEALEWLGAF